MVLSLVGCTAALFASQIEYDPQIAQIINEVSEDTLISTISHLSGEEPVTIAGVLDSIPCRYAYSPGCYDAARWLTERMAAAGVSAEMQPFVPMEMIDVDILPSGKGWASFNSMVPSMYVHPVRNSLYRTDDAGASWQVAVKDDTSAAWGEIVSLSEDSAWAAAGTKLMRTVEGETWQLMLEVTTATALNDICAVGSTHGWAVGDLGTLISTADAWVNWEESYPFAQDLSQVDFISTNNGWIASEESLWVTIDGGETWSPQDQPLYRITGVEFLDAHLGYLAGYSEDRLGSICKTQDGGNTWDVLFDTLSSSPYDICVKGSDSLWVVGSGGMVLFSDDAGITFSRREVENKSNLKAIDVIADGRGVLGGWTEILHTTDGETWFLPDSTNLDWMWNVVGTLKGTDETEVIITAHYDAISEDSMNYTPGADDNASGVSAVLESARLLSGYDWQNTLKFVLFSGEEVGMWGSFNYALQSRHKHVLGFLNADMIAYDGNDDRQLAVYGYTEWNPLSEETGSIFNEIVDIYNLDIDPGVYDLWHSSDAMCLWWVGIPGISVGEDRSDFNPFYHSTDETLDKLNTPYLTEGTKACVAWMATMANMDSLGQVREEVVTLKEMVELRLSSSIMHAQGWVEISSPYPVTPRIYDVTGRKVKTLASVQASEGAIRIPLEVSGLPSGVYWITVQGKAGLVSERFVLVR
jgi:photosystem II stability/assembly factor-like uncharacterized protein